MPVTVTPIALPLLTTKAVDGTGVFDVLMQAVKGHLEQEFNKNRIKGPEYATVYLGSLEAVLQNAIAFLMARDKTNLEAELLQQQIVNAKKEELVLIAQECKLRAEYDLILAQKAKTDQEKILLEWKVTTEKAQTVATGVDENSVIGKQKALYAAQTAGFQRDAEQKGAKILIDTWNTRRMTDEATVADGTNKLYDASVGRAVTALLAGMGA